VFFKKLELYTTIEDLPIGNFQRIMKEGDLKHMIQKGKFKKTFQNLKKPGLIATISICKLLD